MDIIDATDLTSYLGDDSLNGDPRLDLLVDLANGIVSEVIGEQVADWIPPSRVVAITLEVAARAFRNPEGYSSETIDDYTYRRDADTRKAGIYLTNDELEELGVGTGVPRAFVGWLA